MRKLYWNLEVRSIAQPLKRFWLFLSPQYEASGGMDDFNSSFDTLQEAVDSVTLLHHDGGLDEGHIYDSLTNQIMGYVSTRPVQS